MAHQRLLQHWSSVGRGGQFLQAFSQRCSRDEELTGNTCPGKEFVKLQEDFNPEEHQLGDQTRLKAPQKVDKAPGTLFEKSA
jgi:hypothetical protein